MSNLQHVDSADHFSVKEKINHYLYSPANIAVLAILTIIAFIFSLEFVFYSTVILYSVYVIAFCPDLSPLLPLFTLCYFAVSRENNPGVTDQGVFYGRSAVLLLCLVALVIAALIFRISLDKKIGWKVFFTKRRQLLPGILTLGCAYLVSGFGNEHFFEIAERNFIFAFIQFLSIFLLYFVFSATIDWERFDVDYFAHSQLISGLVVVFELVWTYITEDIIVDGMIDRESIFTGWGTYNNMGVIIAMSIPFAFYFACKKKHSAVYLFSALVLMVSIIFTCSRSSLLFASLAFLVSYIYTFTKANNKKEFRLSSVIILVVSAIGVLMLFTPLKDIFVNVPTIADNVGGSIVFNDYDRFNIYSKGWNAFLKNPFFGQTFYSFDYNLFDWSVVDQFSSFFPPRWHNTFIQLLASCGLIGLGAYFYHRYQTIRLFIKKRTKINVYIGISIFTLLCMSMLDSHFFNVGPVLVYSMALATAEYGKES